MTPQEMAALAEFLRGCRDAAGLSLRRAAELSDVEPSQLLRLEAGTIRKPDVDKLGRLGETLGFTVSEALTAAGSVSPEAAYPTFVPYLRSRYGQLPEDAVDEMSKAFDRIAAKYGVDPDGPADGEDEEDPPRRKAKAKNK
jgi:hypothetical protein